MFECPDWDNGVSFSADNGFTQDGTSGRLGGKSQQNVKKSKKRKLPSSKKGENLGDISRVDMSATSVTLDSDDESRRVSKKAKKRLKEKKRKQKKKSLNQDGGESGSPSEIVDNTSSSKSVVNEKKAAKKKRRRHQFVEPFDFHNADLMKLFQEAGLLAKKTSSPIKKDNGKHGVLKNRERSELPTFNLTRNSSVTALSPVGENRKKRKRRHDDSVNHGSEKKMKINSLQDFSETASADDAAWPLSKTCPTEESESVKKRKKRKRSKNKLLAVANNDSGTTDTGQSKNSPKVCAKGSALPTGDLSYADKTVNGCSSSLSEGTGSHSEDVEGKKRRKKNSKKTKHKNLAEKVAGRTGVSEEVHLERKNSTGSSHTSQNDRGMSQSDSLQGELKKTTLQKPQKQKKAKTEQSLLENSPKLPATAAGFTKKGLHTGETVKTRTPKTGSGSDAQGTPDHSNSRLPFNRQRLAAMLKSSSVKLASESEEDLCEKAASVKPESLQERLEAELNAAHFRYLNEKLYKCRGDDARTLFSANQEAFQVYHEGFQSQVARWPVNPLDVIIREIKSRPTSLKIADFGCGDAKLARSVPHQVHSFDLIALNEHVTVCDMAKVPLPDGSVHMAVFCLSLMGTNLIDYLLEANRVLKQGGTLKIAEVASRLNRLTNFIVDVEKLGFICESKDVSNKMFFLMDFKKKKTVRKNRDLPEISLPPCLYKKR